MLKELLLQLELETDTPYHAIPYDYRMSQILVEGMLGTLPEVPLQVVEKWTSETGKNLPNNTAKFRTMWNKNWQNNRQNRATPIRESKVISNYAATNLLPRHLQSEQKASLIHGAKMYAPWDRDKYVSGF